MNNKPINQRALLFCALLKKTPLAMRITLVVIFVFAFQVQAHIYSQNTKISLELKNSTVEKVLKTIEEKSEYYFLYNSRLINVDREVSVRVKDATIAAVLEELFKSENVNYEVKESQIILSPKEMHKTTPSIVEGIKQQKKSITGTIVDVMGEPIIGANVIEKGTTNGTVTDIDGNFCLLVQENASLDITYIGYLSQNISTKERNVIKIILHEDTKTLDEVVVIGYGTARRGDLTGAISSIKAEKMESEAPRDIADLMRSTAAGLNVGITASANSTLVPSVRGATTLTAGSEPTIVLDGVIYYGSLSDINVNNVESIDVLKDASSAAVYGSQAANGVIVITTKKGKGKADGAPTITLNANVGFDQSARQMKILDGKGYIKYRQDYVYGNETDEYLAKYPEIFTSPMELSGTGVSPLDWYNYGQTTPVTSVTDEELTRTWLSRLRFFTPEIDNYLAGIETDWSKLVLRNGLQQDYTIDVSNKTDKVAYNWSLGYVDRDGIVVGDNYKNVRTRLNIDSKITDFLTIGMNSNFAVRDESAQAVPWEAMYRNSPYGSNNLDDLESLYRYYIVGDVSTSNPLYAREYRDQSKVNYSLHSNLYAQVKLPFEIEYQVNFTPYYQWYNEYYHQYVGSVLETNGGNSRRRHDMNYHWTVDNILRWKKEINNIHNIEFTFLANKEKRQTWSTTATTSNYDPSDVLGYHFMDAGLIPKVSSNDTYWTGDALMGRMFYSYQNKYMLTVSSRQDGYSAFGQNNKRAIFPSVALGYVLTSEDFMKGSADWLNYLKLRFSWGQNGNRAIGQYAALANMTTNNYPYINNSGSAYTSTYIYVSTMANRNLKWERTESNNLGVDFSLFGDLLNGSVELYSGTTKDLLVARSLPSITGFSSVMANLGKLKNKGFELTLNSDIIRNKNVSWSAFSTFSMNRREIISLYGDMENVYDDLGNIVGQKETDDPTNGWFIGQDPDRIWSYERLGVWQLDEKEEASVYGASPGDFKYKDQNGDGVLTNEDRVFQGYTTPRARISLRNDFTFYKNFNVSFTMYSHLGHYGQFNEAANYNFGQPYRFSSYDIPRWTKDNPTNDYARIASYNAGTNWVKKSFIRLDNFTLSYNLPSVFLQKMHVQRARLTFTVRNMGVWSPNWTFWDPETGSLSPRSYNMGINFTL